MFLRKLQHNDFRYATLSTLSRLENIPSDVSFSLENCLAILIESFADFLSDQRLKLVYSENIDTDQSYPCRKMNILRQFCNLEM